MFRKIGPEESEYMMSGLEAIKIFKLLLSRNLPLPDSEFALDYYGTTGCSMIDEYMAEDILACICGIDGYSIEEVVPGERYLDDWTEYMYDTMEEEGMGVYEVFIKHPEVVKYSKNNYDKLMEYRKLGNDPTGFLNKCIDLMPVIFQNMSDYTVYESFFSTYKDRGVVIGASMVDFTNLEFVNNLLDLIDFCTEENKKQEVNTCEAG